MPKRFSSDHSSVQEITAIIPAYNEAASIAATIISLQRQTYPIAEIIVVDDCSTDDTGSIAKSTGARVLRPSSNTGSKAGAQTYALAFVRTVLCMAIDADTEVALDGVERLVGAFAEPSVAAASGFVLPRHVASVWERGRYIEYLFAFSFFKPVQDFFDRPLISSGCFSAYRTSVLESLGGWSNRTMAEDMDLTWTMYAAGHRVRFVPGALCYPIEPQNLHFLSKQLKRWSHGFLQNVRIHWRNVIDQPYLRAMIAISLWDATVASLAYLLLLPLLAGLLHPLFLLGYIIDLPTVGVPVIAKGIQRGELGRVIVSLPCFFLLRIVNSVFMLKAVWAEFIVGRPLLVYEKGH
jgi:poly-beta-1,6-N-acetyl-D-glucosamine synthase